MGDPIAIGIDVGGTKIAAGLVSRDGTVSHREQHPTPDDGDTLVQALVDVAGHLSGTTGSRLPVGLGFPALVTLDGYARYGPNIVLREYPLRDQLRRMLGHDEVVVENDATAAAWAEYRAGVGVGIQGHLVLFTLGTGVGGGLVLDGRLYRGAHGFAGELGHFVVQQGGEDGPSGVPGELEAYSSGSAIGRMARVAHARGAFAGTALEGPVAPSPAQVTQAAREGLVPAVEILATAGRYLGIAAAGFVNALDPEIIVVGGGAAEAGELILAPAREALQEHVLGAAHRLPVPIVAARLGPDAGLIGAALLAAGV